MNNELDEKRLREIDILKAIAIIMVVYEHVIVNTMGLYTGFVNYVHMPIFYFVSGYFFFEELTKYSVGKVALKK